MWFIYTMEYYSDIKNEDVLSFTGKWTENTILSEVTQTQKDMHGMYALISGYEKKKNLGYCTQYPRFSPQNVNKLNCPSEDSSVPLGREKTAITSGEIGRELRGKVDEVISGERGISGIG